MKLTPFFSMDGIILGHVDLDMCRRTRNSVVIDNGPSDWSKCPMPTPTTPESLSPIEMYHIPLREIMFRSRREEVTVYHLVIAAEETLPPWFWDSKAIVKFTPGSWKLVG